MNIDFNLNQLLSDIMSNDTFISGFAFGSLLTVVIFYLANIENRKRNENDAKRERLLLDQIKILTSNPSTLSK